MKEDKKKIRLAPTDSEGLPIYPFSDEALNPGGAVSTPVAATPEPSTTAMQAIATPAVATQTTEAHATPAPAPAKKLETPKSPFDFDKRLPKTEEKPKKEKSEFLKKIDNKLLIYIGVGAVGLILLIFSVIMIISTNASNSKVVASSPEMGAQAGTGGGKVVDETEEKDEDGAEEDEEDDGEDTQDEKQEDTPAEKNVNTVPTDADNADANVKSRDSSRKESLAKLNEAIMNYRSNNNNKLPSEGSVVVGATEPNIVVTDNSGYPDFAANANSWGYFYTSYLLVGGMETFADPDGNPYSLVISECGTETVGDACEVGQRTNVSFTDQSSGIATDFGPVGHSISIVTHSNCDNGKAVYSTSTKKVSLIYRKEAGGVLCVSE